MCNFIYEFIYNYFQGFNICWASFQFTQVSIIDWVNFCVWFYLTWKYENCEREICMIDSIVIEEIIFGDLFNFFFLKIVIVIMVNFLYCVINT